MVVLHVGGIEQRRGHQQREDAEPAHREEVGHVLDRQHTERGESDDPGHVRAADDAVGVAHAGHADQEPQEAAPEEHQGARLGAGQRLERGDEHGAVEQQQHAEGGQAESGQQRGEEKGHEIVLVLLIGLSGSRQISGLLLTRAIGKSRDQSGDQRDHP